VDKQEKVKKLAELFDLVQFYYEYRDQPQPVNGDGDFFFKVENCCAALEIDFEEFKKEFKLLR